MENAKFQQSILPDSPHALLSSLCGDWTGSCRTWFEPGKLADESPIQASIRPLLSGRFVQLEEEGTLMGEAMHGLATIGYYDDRRRFEVAWINNLHMGTGLLFSTGEAFPGGFSVLGSYPDPSGGPDWDWRTELKVIDADNFILTAYNITPNGEAAKATEAVYRRTNG
jgi:hypothetical protein